MEGLKVSTEDGDKRDRQQDKGQEDGVGVRMDYIDTLSRVLTGFPWLL
jgi:hypothetical protein